MLNSTFSVNNDDFLAVAPIFILRLTCGDMGAFLMARKDFNLYFGSHFL
jgi:hypothetical protein